MSVAVWVAEYAALFRPTFIEGRLRRRRGCCRSRPLRAAGLEIAAGDRRACGVGWVEPDDKAGTAIAAARIAASALDEILSRQHFGIGLRAGGESDIAIVVRIVDIAVDMDVIAAPRHGAGEGGAR